MQCPENQLHLIATKYIIETMTTSLRLLFIVYIALLSSFDTALAEELQEIEHGFTHDHSLDNADVASDTELNPLKDETPKNRQCPDSEGCHSGHHCHMGHCGFLQPSFVFKEIIKNNEIFSGYSQMYLTRPLDSLFRPPRLG